ncbi:polymorphic toxin type 30 domain-containing protein [Streptomyces sp. IBSBF 2435]|uniref:polymorphic toxin type 30 domain-containing protein n=1 Tax=Streptomyces sp. IBSBF 2435 TaxID=2903531 RepID=UPI002FDC1624
MILPLTEVTDRNGNSWTITHDKTGVPSEVRHSGGYHLTLTSDNGRITELRLQDPSAADAPGTAIRTYGYDAVGNMTEVTNSSGLPHRYMYDTSGRITSWTDRNDTTYAYTYDQRGRCVATSGTDGFLNSTFAYDDTTRTTTFTNSLGHSSTYTHNAAYRLISETDPLGHTTRREWDTANRRLVALTDPLDRTIRYSYDSDGNLVSLIRPDGAVATAEYNVFGLPLRISEPGGAIWIHTYDDLGSLLSTTDPVGAVTRYHRNSRGALVGKTDPLGRTHRYEVNAAGLRMGATDPLGHTTHVERDGFGHLTAFTDPLRCTTRMEWTPDGKPEWRESPDGARETWRWDGEGNLTAFSDPAGHTTRYTYTHFDLVASRSEPNGAVRTFEYDTELRLRQVTDALGHHWTYTYDPAGRLTSERDFGGRTLTYALNAAGQLMGRTNGAGETHAFVLDSLGRVTEQRTSTGEVSTYTYDDAGRLVSAANSEATLSYVRDALGRPLTETVNDRTTRYTYDAAGRRTSRTTPSGHTSTWTYDAVGRPEELITSAGSLTLAHDAAGRATERRIGGNLLLTQRWDTTGRLSGQAVVATQPAQAERLLHNRTYAYRDDGYLSEVQDVLDGTRRYDLDAVGRITAVHASTGTEIYDYDATGNLTRAMVPGNAYTLTDRDFSGAIIRRSGRTVYQHDAQGRLVRKTLRHLSGAKKTWTYAWNAEDRLVQAVTPDGLTWRYTYDPLGRRIAKLHSLDGTSHTTTFAWEGTRLAEERSPEGRTTTWDYAPGTHTALAQTASRAVLLRPDPNSPASPPPGPPSSSGADLSFYAVITDPVGSPTELVAQDATIPWRSRHDVWGVAHPASKNFGEAYCPLRFPGQYADDETGFNYNYHRYYDPETARYISPDPLGLIPADNHYGYVDNPLAWQDALGLAPCKGYDLRGKDPMSIVPDDAKIRELTPHSGGGSQYGLEYSWKNDAGQTVRLRIHGPDGTAPVGSNSASGETYRIQIGRQYQDEAGNLYHHQSHNPNSPNYNPNAANATHIPWPSEYPGL